MTMRKTMTPIRMWNRILQAFLRSVLRRPFR
jgi:hypothetical protein